MSSNGWREVKLGDVINFRNGRKRPDGQGDIPIFGGNGILGYTNSFNNKNAVIVGRVGAYCGSVFYEPGKCWISDNAISAQPQNDNSVNYIYYALMQLRLNERRIGTGQPLLTQSILNNIETIYPMPDQQKAIVGTLACIDAKIELNNKINDNLQQQIDALFNLHFTDKAPTSELNCMVDVRDGTHDSPKPVESGYPLITSKHLQPYEVDASSSNYITKADYDKINERSNVETKDILISMIGTVGLISFVTADPVNFAIKNVGLFKTSQSNDLCYYILCHLRSKAVSNHINMCLAGSTQKYISLGELRKIPIYAPSTDELGVFNRLTAPLFQFIIGNCKEIKTLSLIRDTLLPKLMSGEIDVSEVQI